MKYEKITNKNNYACIKGNFSCSIFQSWEWGVFKNEYGWNPVRYKIVDSSIESDLFSFQILEKKIFGIFYILWIPGINFDLGSSNLKKSEISLSILLDIVDKNYKFYYLRLSSLYPITHKNAFSMSRLFTKPCISLNSGFSLYLDLEKDRDEWLINIAKKHRYYIKRSNKNNIEWYFGHDNKLIDDFSEILNEVERKKNAGSLGYNKEGYYRLKKLFGSRQKILIGYIDNKPISGCVVIIDGDSAFYMSAATNEKGRSVSAAYSMIDRLRIALRNEKIIKLDFGGVSPDAFLKNGVSHFKKGFGGEIVQYIGEWEHGRRISKILGNIAILLLKNK